MYKNIKTEYYKEIPFDPFIIEKYFRQYIEKQQKQTKYNKRHRRKMERYLCLIKEAKRMLSERQKQIFELYYEHEKNQKQISQILGISRRAVRIHLKKAIQKIKSYKPIRRIIKNAME